MSKIRIRFFSDYCSSEHCKMEHETMCNLYNMDNYGPTKDFYIVCDDKYTHAIIINKATPVLSIPKENVIGLAYEPTPFLRLSPEFIKYTEKYISKYLIGDSKNLPHQFVNKYSFMTFNPPPHSKPIKNRPMSIMVSQKYFAPGHIYRHRLVEAILRSDLDIDIYGRGCYLHDKNDPRIKGIFSKDEPYERYNFHICIENYILDEYTSEKYINTIIFDATPIYLGCNNPLFPEYTIKLYGNIQDDIKLLRQIIENQAQYKQNIDQDIVLHRLNIINHFDDLFSN